MNKTDRFAFRIGDEERHAIKSLAESLQRSQSDAVRFVVLNTARNLAKAKIEALVPTYQLTDLKPVTKTS